MYQSLACSPVLLGGTVFRCLSRENGRTRKQQKTEHSKCSPVLLGKEIKASAAKRQRGEAYPEAAV
jgi:hypothetical protein